ncbi:MAG: monovalent cation/H+ antiporter complex subunit F [Eubacteriales bacterium]|nr:monovalent cation/H+ antiporter complex subunit F [Eubacteriales bacterium]
MSDFVIFAVFFAALAILNLIRVILGPTPADRQVAGDNADILITCALVLFSLFSGRAVYLDIAIISAMLGIIDTMLVGRYLDRGRWHYDADSDHS